MEIPNDFKNAIKSVFYDKTITKYTSSNVVDDEGWSRDGSLSSNGTFLAHVNISKLAEIQETYGITEDIDILFITEVTVTTDLGDILGYDGRYYRVINSYLNDSHKLIFCKVWSSKSSISPSV